jgi:hypothetical protein
VDVPDERGKNMADSGLKAAHIALWDWLYQHPAAWKRHWPGWRENGGKLFAGNSCFACTFAGFDEYADPRCDNCPLDQNVMHGCRQHTASAYVCWERASDPEIRKKYAAMIRDAWLQGAAFE